MALYGDTTKVVYEFARRKAPAEALFLGIYPPRKANASKPHDNDTCRGIAREYGTFDFNFCDAFPFSPNGKSSDLDNDLVFQELKENEALIADWLRRVRGWLDMRFEEGNKRCVMYVCGVIVQYFWDRQTVFKFSRMLDTSVGVALYSAEFPSHIPHTKEIIVMENQYHPSAYLMAAGRQDLRHEHRYKMRLLSALRKVKDESIDRVIPLMTTYADEAERLRLKRVKEFADFFGFSKGRWPRPMQHCRLLPLQNDNVYGALSDVKTAVGDPKVLRRLMTNSCLTAAIVRTHGGSPSAKADAADDKWCNIVGAFSYLSKLLGKEAAATLFSSGCFAKRIATDRKFVAKFEELHALLGAAAVKSLFSSGCFANRIATDRKFVAKFEEPHALLGAAAFKSLFRSGSFCTRISQNPDFLKIFEELHALLGAAAVKSLFRSGSFCARISQNPDFLKIFEELDSLLGAAAVRVLFSTNSFCVQISHNPDFLKTFKELDALLGAAAIKSLFSSDSFCVGIGNNTNFLIKFRQFVTDMGPYLARVLFRGDCFSARVRYQLEGKRGYAGFMDVFGHYRKLIDNDDMTAQLFATGQFSSRLLEVKQLRAAFDDVLAMCTKFKIPCYYGCKFFAVGKFPEAFPTYVACLRQAKSRLDLEYLLKTFFGSNSTLVKLVGAGALLVKQFPKHPSRSDLGLVESKRKRKMTFAEPPKKYSCPVCQKRVIRLQAHRKRASH